MGYVIHQGDCLASLRSMEARSVHCCVTSPPYFGLRQYMANGVRLRADLDPETRAKIVAHLQEIGVFPYGHISR